MEKLTGSDLQFTDLLENDGGKYARHNRETVLPAMTGAGIRFHGKKRPYKTTNHRIRWMKIIYPLDIRSQKLGGTRLKTNDPDGVVFSLIRTLELRTKRAPGKQKKYYYGQEAGDNTVFSEGFHRNIYLSEAKVMKAGEKTNSGKLREVPLFLYLCKQFAGNRKKVSRFYYLVLCQ